MEKLITAFGVLPNSSEIQTKKIQIAIDECAKSGDTLVFLEGVYNSGTLCFRSNAKIKLEKGAVISGAHDLSHYPDNEASFVDAVGRKRGKCLAIAYKTENLEIFGEGEICGNGQAFLDERPFLFRFIEAKNCKLSGIKLSASPSWCLHINQSSNIEIDGISIDNRVNANNDGIDIDSSKNISIKNSHIVSDDDGICLKSTSDIPCKGITVRNCKISSGWGAIKIGTESMGDFSDISIEDCYVYDTLGGGIKIVPTDGGSVDGVSIKNIKMDNTAGPIFIISGTRMREYMGKCKKTKSFIKNVLIENITADTVSAPERGEWDGGVWGNAHGEIIISGTKENPIENLTLKNIKADLPGGIKDYEEHEVPYVGEKYPEFHRMDIVPAKGIFARDVLGLNLENVSLTYKEEDVREEIVLENVK